jgi:hypothetical protein
VEARSHEPVQTALVSLLQHTAVRPLTPTLYLWHADIPVRTVSTFSAPQLANAFNLSLAASGLAPSPPGMSRMSSFLALTLSPGDPAPLRLQLPPFCAFITSSKVTCGAMVVPSEHLTGFLVSAMWTVSNVAWVRFSAGVESSRRGDSMAFRRVVEMPSKRQVGLGISACHTALQWECGLTQRN